MIEIDGNYLEGGGQIVRTALALSTVMQKAVRITCIRKGRDKPGLKNQHLYGIAGLKELCNAQVEGNYLGSTELTYWPGQIKGGTLNLDIGTAGSISLMVQTLLLPALSVKCRLKVTGGTSGKWAMPFDYFSNVLLPHLTKYAKIDAHLLRRGYYPTGGGRVDIKISPLAEEHRSINQMEQGTLIQIKGISHASNDLQKAQVAERQAHAAKSVLGTLQCPIQIRAEYCDTLCTGSGITLWAIFSLDPDEIDFRNPILIGADALGEKEKRAESVGNEAAQRLLDEINSKAPVDRHLADSLIPFLAVYGGQIKVSEITKHTLTNIATCEQFLPNPFSVDAANRIISYVPEKPKPF